MKALPAPWPGASISIISFSLSFLLLQTWLQQVLHGIFAFTHGLMIGPVAQNFPRPLCLNLLASPVLCTSHDTESTCVNYREGMTFSRPLSHRQAASRQDWPWV